MSNPLIQRAQLLFSQHRYDLAADACREALGQMPQDAYGHALLGLCLVRLEQYEEATAEARQAVELAPDDAFSHYALGAVYQNRNHFAAAETAARQAVELVPEDPDYWALLAESVYAQERWAEALEAANSGLQYDPEHVLCTNLRAMALVKLGDKQGAAQAISEALQRNPHNSLSHANQGWTMLHQGDHRQALEHFRESLRLNPNDSWAQEGMMAALKAKYVLYRIMLRYYLWMSRIGRKGQWAVIIGLWVIMESLSVVKARNPGLAPWIYPVIVGYTLFVFANWLADPIFNLTLLVSPYGRYLLKMPQRIGAVVVGVMLACAVAFTVLGFLGGETGVFAGGLLLLILTLPAAATFRCREMNRVVIMGVYSLAVAGAGVVGLGLLMMGDKRGGSFITLALWGCILSSVAANVLGHMVQKK